MPFRWPGPPVRRESRRERVFLRTIRVAGVGEHECPGHDSVCHRGRLDCFVTLRDIFIQNFAGDLEYHPGRAVLYFALAVAAFCFWIFSSSNMQFTSVPLVFGPGSLALLIKGIFLMRKSSESLGLSDQELAELSVINSASQPNHSGLRRWLVPFLAASQDGRGYRQVME